MMSKVRCAVIGAGSWGTTAHIPAIKSHTQAELVAVQHHDRGLAARIARHFDVPHACTTAEEVLAIEGLDAVVVSSIPALHYSQAKAALSRGCHVLIEKPMTIRSTEAEELVALADARGVHFVLGATWHYTTHSKEARRIVQSGELGRIKMISILMTNLTEGLYRGQSLAETVQGANDEHRVEFKPPLIEPSANSYSDPKLAGGGQICCQTSHPGAYVSYLTERKPLEVFARFENDGAPVDIYNSIHVTLDDGTLVTLATNGAAAPKKMHYEVRVFGSAGVLAQELWDGTLEVYDRNGSVRKSEPLEAEQIYPMFAPATNLINAVIGNEENGSPARHGVVATQISECACESSRTGAVVTVPQNIGAL